MAELEVLISMMSREVVRGDVEDERLWESRVTVATESRHDASGERLCVLIHALRPKAGIGPGTPSANLPVAACERGIGLAGRMHVAEELGGRCTAAAGDARVGGGGGGVFKGLKQDLARWLN